MPKEIIVYLDDYKYSGDGNYDTMYLDFRTADDYTHYIRELGMKEMTLGSYLRIDGYRSPKRLMRGAYYSLNMGMLKQMTPQPVTNSLVFAHYYSFDNYRGQNDEKFHLLQTHEPLVPAELQTSFHNKVEFLDWSIWDDNLNFCVNDVSQANWNVIRRGDTALYVYDIGAPIHATVKQVQEFIDNYADEYKKSQPVLILSHWDLDHYHCLLKLNNDEIDQYFSKFICVDKMKTATSQKVFKRMVSIMGKDRIFCIQPPARTLGSAYSRAKKVYAKEGIGLYICETNINLNYCGLIFYLEGTKAHVIFTGDSLPVQASNVFAKVTIGSEKGKDHYLVVPHHGGDFKGKKVYKTYHIPEKVTPIEAIISVDESNNTYGHPSKEMMDFLGAIGNYNESGRYRKWKITRTDKNGTICHNISHDALDNVKKEHERLLMENLEKNSDFFSRFEKN